MKTGWLAAAAAVVALPTWAAAPGTLDPDFGSAGTATITISDANTAAKLPLAGLHPLNNGGWLVTATRTAASPNRNDMLIARFRANGSLDTGMGAAGYKVIAPAIVTQQWQAMSSSFSGGVLYIGADSGKLIKLNGTGDKDNAFGRFGEVSWQPVAERTGSIAQLHAANGAGWAVGHLTYTNDQPSAIFVQKVLPLNAAATAPNAAATVYKLKGYPVPLAYTPVGGGGLIAGSFHPEAAQGGIDVELNRDFLLLKHTATGALDKTFNGTGWQRISFAGNNAEAQMVTVLKSGQYFAAGCVVGNVHPNMISPYVSPKVVAALVNKNGGLDTRFANQGRLSTTIKGCAIAATELETGAIRVAIDQGNNAIGFIELSPQGEITQRAGLNSSAAETTASTAADIPAIANSVIVTSETSSVYPTPPELRASKYVRWQDSAAVLAYTSGNKIHLKRYLFDDDDQDDVLNQDDNCRYIENADQADLDGDGMGDVCDDDRDGDGVANGQDAFPDDASEWLDTDGDGIGDNADTDDDNDGIPDEDDLFPLDPNLLNEHKGSAKGAQAGARVLLVADYDADGISDYLVSEPAANVRVNGKMLKKAGRVELRSGASLEAIHVFEGQQANEQFGLALASWPAAGEALPRLVIGAPLAAVASSDKPLKKAGVVRVYQATGAVGTFTETQLQAPEPAAGSQFGSALAANTERLLIGAPLAALADPVSGKAFKQAGKVFSASADFVVTLVASGSTAKEKFGASVAIAESDIWAAGAPGRAAVNPLTNKPLKNAGGIVVFDADDVRWLSGVAANDQLGSVLAPQFDGAVLWAGVPKADVLLGKKRVKDAGQVWAIESGAEPVSYTVIQAQLPTAKQGFGQALAKTAGLLAVGSPLAKNGKLAQAGRVDLYTCTATVCSFGISLHGQAAKEQLGFSLDVSRDINSDGVQDVVIGQPGVLKKQGQAQVYSGAALLRQ